MFNHEELIFRSPGPIETFGSLKNTYRGQLV